MKNQEIINQGKSTSICIMSSKECSDYSGKIYQTLTDDEKQQMQKFMTQSCKMENGIRAIREIRWAYRAGQDGEGYNVTVSDRDDAAEISLECDRHGIIKLNKRVTALMQANATKHSNDCQKIYGNRV